MSSRKYNVREKALFFIVGKKAVKRNRKKRRKKKYGEGSVRIPIFNIAYLFSILCPSNMKINIIYFK